MSPLSSPQSPATTARAGAAVGVPLVAGARLPLAFIALGLGMLFASAAWGACRPAVFLLPHVHPHLVAHAHLWLPGFLLSVSTGAIYQLMPVVLGAPLGTREAAAWTHFGLHAAGTVLLVTGFVLGRFEIVAVGGASVAGGIVLLVRAAWKTFAAATRRDAIAWSFPLAATWLLATVVIGAFIAANRAWPTLPVSTLSLVRVHAHLGLAGFFVTLLQGATFQLVPMFTMGEMRRPRLVAAGIFATQAGLPLLALGWIGNLPAVNAIGAAVLLAGMAASGLALKATFQTRRRRRPEPGVRAFLAGMAIIGVASLAGGALVGLPVAGPQTTTAYGAVSIGGGLALAVMGMLCKILPFLVWMRVYGPRIGREPVPAATALASPRLEKLWIVLHLAAVATLVAGIIAGSTVWTALGAWLLAAAVTSFLANALRIAAHLWRPAPAASSSPAPTPNLP